MLARQICSGSRLASRVALRGQTRFISVTPKIRDANKPDLHAKETANLNKMKGMPSTQGGSGGMNPMYLALGAVALGGAIYLYKSRSAKEVIESGKDKVAGKYMAHKATKEFEKAKEIIVNVAKEIGGKDLADKVSKMIDEAKDTLSKMADNYPEAKDKLEKVAGSLSHGDAKDKLSGILRALGASGLDKYIEQFDSAKDSLIKEAKKHGGDDVTKKVEKVYDEAKDKIQKMVKNFNGKDFDKMASDFDSVKESIISQIKKIGGDDLAKKATQYFDEAKSQIQKIAGGIDDGKVISDEQYKMAKDFVVKEAEKLGGRDLAKKAAKLMDEAKEKIQKLAHELKN